MKRVKNYIIHTDKLLGKGTFGAVYKGYYDIDDSSDPKKKMALAVKVTSYDSDKRLIASLNEIRNYLDLKHPNIVNYIDAVRTQRYLYFIMEYCNEGSLQDLLKQLYSKGKPSEIEILSLFRDIIDGFRYLIIHKKKIHRDIKPDNIFINNGVLKIGDFGTSTDFDDVEQRFKDPEGTPIYMDPNLVKGDYNTKCDIYSLGIMLWHMLFYKSDKEKPETGSFPFLGKNEKEFLENKLEKELKFPDKVRVISEKTKQLITAMLQNDLSQRITWEDLFKHELLKPKVHFDRKQFEQNELEQQADTEDIEENEELLTKEVSEWIEKEKSNVEFKEIQKRLKFEFQKSQFFYRTGTKFFEFAYKPRAQSIKRSHAYQFLYILYKRGRIIMHRLHQCFLEGKNAFELESWDDFYEEKNTFFLEMKEDVKVYYQIHQKNFDNIMEELNKELDDIPTSNKEFINNSYQLPASYADEFLQHALKEYLLVELKDIRSKFEEEEDLSKRQIKILYTIDSMLIAFTQQETLVFNPENDLDLEDYEEKREISPHYNIFQRILLSYCHLNIYDKQQAA